MPSGMPSSMKLETGFSRCDEPRRLKPLVFRSVNGIAEAMP
jgi:hypothetical protein